LETIERVAEREGVEVIQFRRLVLVRRIGLVIDFPVVLGSRDSIMRQSMETSCSSSAFPSAASFASIRLSRHFTATR
jgi:hypothetical protein